MKLETKHIIPYLGHNLHILVDDVICEVEGIDLYQKDTVIAERVNYKLENVKLLLRPLSDLTKEMDVYGKKYVAIDFIHDYYYSNLTKNEFKKIFNEYKIALGLIPNYLLMWHFDIYGLIEKGLAIDINTLK